jgi:hypothetical protein
MPLSPNGQPRRSCGYDLRRHQARFKQEYLLAVDDGYSRQVTGPVHNLFQFDQPAAMRA